MLDSLFDIIDVSLDRKSRVMEREKERFEERVMMKKRRKEEERELKRKEFFDDWMKRIEMKMGNFERIMPLDND